LENKKITGGLKYKVASLPPAMMPLYERSSCMSLIIGSCWEVECLQQHSDTATGRKRSCWHAQWPAAAVFSSTPRQTHITLRTNPQTYPRPDKISPDIITLQKNPGNDNAA